MSCLHPSCEMTTETESKLSDLADCNRQKLHPIMLKTNCPRTLCCEDLRYKHRPDSWEPQPGSESHNTKVTKAAGRPRMG